MEFTKAPFMNETIMPQNNFTEDIYGGKFISDEFLYWLQLTNYIALCGLLSIIGITTNLINIIVFIRQGAFSDSSTVSLLGLTFTDLMCAVTLLWFSICFSIIYIQPSNLNFDPFALMVVTAGRPHSMFVQITCIVTMFISLERCMCVMLPLKFKLIFTPKRTALIMPSIFILSISISHVPLYSNEYLKWQSFGNTSEKFLTYYQEGSYLKVFEIVSYYNQCIRVMSVLGVLTFTQITAHRVDATSKWRKKMTSADSYQTSSKTTQSSAVDAKKDVAKPTREDQISQKDKKLIRMIRVICILFLVCYAGDLVCITIERIEPEIRPGGKYNNLFFFTYAITFVLEGINSCSNIMIYYKMSTKYRTEFRRLFGIADDSKE